MWATAFIYFDEKKTWRLAGFEQMLVLHFTCKTRLKRGGGTPKIFYTGATEQIKAELNVGI